MIMMIMYSPISLAVTIRPHSVHELSQFNLEVHPLNHNQMPLR